MPRIAAAILVLIASFAFNDGFLRGVSAAELAVRSPTAQVATTQQVAPQSSKILSLLLILESLRQSAVSLDAQKV